MVGHLVVAGSSLLLRENRAPPVSPVYPTCARIDGGAADPSMSPHGVLAFTARELLGPASLPKRVRLVGASIGAGESRGAQMGQVEVGASFRAASGAATAADHLESLLG